MEEAAIHAVDGLQGQPAMIFVLGILIIIACISVAYFKFVLPPKRELEKQKVQNDADQFKEKLAFDREREQRKREESKERSDRDKENAVIMARSVEAQERSNIVMSEATSQLAILNAKLDMSQERSAMMGVKVESMEDVLNDVAHDVRDIHKDRFGN